MSGRVLLVDDDRAVREAMGQTLELADLQPLLAGSFVEAKDHIRHDFDGVIVSDIRMPGRDGFDLLNHAQSVDPALPVILLTGEGDIPMAVRGISDGAFDFLEKPCAPGDLLAVVERALKTRGLVMENRRLKARLAAEDAAARMIFGVSAQAEELRDTVRAVAPTAAGVLIDRGAGVRNGQGGERSFTFCRVSRRGCFKRSAPPRRPPERWRRRLTAPAAARCSSTRSPG